MATLIKIDRNGSKHYEGFVTCDRCGGQGGADAWKYTGWTCYKCGGTGKVYGKWIERTPEYQAKLDARRQAKFEKARKEQEAQQAELDQIKKAAEEKAEKMRIGEEARIKAMKAISQYVGNVGEKLTVEGEFVKTAWYEIPSFKGYGKDTVYIHMFKDVNGNKFIWKTSKGLGGLGLQYGEPIKVTGTVKEHSEYDEEKQTALTRCKVVRA